MCHERSGWDRSFGCLIHVVICVNSSSAVDPFKGFAAVVKRSVLSLGVVSTFLLILSPEVIDKYTHGISCRSSIAAPTVRC